MRTVTDYTFGVIPMFLLMGAFVSHSGMSRELFGAANIFVGHLKGGLGIATGGRMRRLCRDLRIFGGDCGDVLGGRLPRCAGSGTGIVLDRRDRGRRNARRNTPAVDRARRLRDHYRAGHRQALHGGCLSRPARRDDDVCTVVLIGMVRPGFLPAGPRSDWKERVQAVRDIWLLLFLFVIGGLYAGLSTPTEAGGMGASGAFLIGLLRGRLTRSDIRRSLLQATRTAAAVFTVLIGALLFGYFLTVTRTPQKVTAFLTGLGLGGYGVLALIMFMYLVLGCLMDAIAMIILTVPIIFPVIKELGFDPIWFGVIIVMTVELGLIHPPVGTKVFVIKSVVQDVKFSTIFLGVLQPPSSSPISSAW